MGTIDAPSWDIVQIAKTATNLYAPLGTQMSLGNYVRILRTFVDAFTNAIQPIKKGELQEEGNVETLATATGEDTEMSTGTETEGSSEMRDLMQGLRVSERINTFAIFSESL